MKQIIKLAFAAVATVTMAACSSDDLTPNKAQDFVPVKTISATIDGENGNMRSTISGTSVVWTSADAFKLYSSDASAFDEFTLVGEGGEKTADFGTATTNVTEGSEGYAIFPAANVTGLASNVVTMTLPSTINFDTQDISGNEFMKSPIPMWSTYSSTGLSFKHLGAVMQIDFKDIPGGTTQVILESSQNISGTFTADLSTAEPVLVYSTGGGKTFAINFPSAISSSDNDRLLFVPLPVGTYDLAIKINDGSEKTIKEWKSFTFARKKLYKTSLTYLESTATTETDLGTDIQNAYAAASAGDKVVINVTGTIAASTDKVEIPVDPSKRVDFELIFANKPTTSSGTPIDFVDKDNSADASGAARNNLRIVMPGGETIDDMNIEMPYTTVTLESSNGSVVTYSHLTQKTATSTLVIADNVRIGAIADATGNAGKISVEGGDVTVAASATIATIEITAGQLIVPSGATVSALSVITDDESTEDAPVVNIAGTVKTLTLEGEKSEVDLVSGGSVETTPTTGVKAKLTNGNTSYFGSITAAQEYGSSPVTEITLLEDMEGTVKKITSDLTLNLNGKTLTCLPANPLGWNWADYGGDNAGIHVVKASLTVNGEEVDGSKGKIKFTYYEDGKYMYYGFLGRADDSDQGVANITINGGEYSFTNQPAGVYFYSNEGGKLNISDASFTSTYASAGRALIEFKGGEATIQNTSVTTNASGCLDVEPIGLGTNPYTIATTSATVKNCTFNVQNSVSEGYYWMNSALACAFGATLTVDGGTYEGGYAAVYVFSSGGTINLKSGTFKGTTYSLRADKDNSGTYMGHSYSEFGKSCIYYNNSSCSLTGDIHADSNDDTIIESKSFD
ncbi:MAG: hypothetical protein IJ190_08000 [Prevotella sp.]|nr:hypothetical protein [Prevotella sp.]